MNLINHPAYQSVRNHIVLRFRTDIYTFKRLRPVVFLCGGANSTRRDMLADYIRKYHSNILVFYADDVWAQIAKKIHPNSKKKARNALAMEKELALLADMVAIVVESPGTFAELGAFSLSDELRSKILPIVNILYKHDESFLNTGPIRWIDLDSAFAPTIFTDFNIILTAAADIDDRLIRIPQLGREKEEVKDISMSPRHLLFLICDLLAIIGPAPQSFCTYYLNKITGRKRRAWNVEDLLGLGVSLRIINTLTNINNEVMYYRPLENGEIDPYLYKHSFNLKSERARYWSVLYKIFSAHEINRMFKAA